MGLCSSWRITDWYSAVGMLRREASSWMMVSTDLRAARRGLCVAITDSLPGRLGGHIINQSIELRFNLEDFGKFGEGPAAVDAQVVDTGHPVGLHSGLLFLRVLPPVAFDLHHQAQRVLAAVVHQG